MGFNSGFKGLIAVLLQYFLAHGFRYNRGIYLIVVLTAPCSCDRCPYFVSHYICGH